MAVDNSSVVAIHQPNFFPWLGFFSKITRADVFVLLDAVQFPKGAGGYGNLVNRVKILIGGNPSWLTIPVVRSYHGTRLISEMEISNTPRWREKLLRTLQFNYKGAPHFGDVYPLLETLVNNGTDNLSEYNGAAIREISNALQIDVPRFVIGSSLNVKERATDMLIAVVKAVGGASYLCGAGAANYQEDEKFLSAGIKLIAQGFVHPEYEQFNREEFVPGLSIIDALMNCGFAGTRALLDPKPRK